MCEYWDRGRGYRWEGKTALTKAAGCRENGGGGDIGPEGGRKKKKKEER